MNERACIVIGASNGWSGGDKENFASYLQT